MTRIRVKTLPCYDFLETNRSREKHLIGGAGSGKSYSIAQYILINKYLTGHKIMIIRKTLPALKLTAYELINNLMLEYKIGDKPNKSELTYRGHNSQMVFKGLDDPEKVKSAEFDTIWVEEATDLTIDDYRQLKLRLGRATEDAEIIFSYNPISQNHWLKTEAIDKDKTISIHHSTYKMNPFLTPTYVKQLEELINQDPNYYRIYALGEWGVLENIIYSNWDTCDSLPNEYEHRIYGLDFGFANPSACVELRIKENEAWIEEIMYKPGLTNPQLIDELSTLKEHYWYADCAEPARIKEFQDAGFIMYPANKEVTVGIDHVKRYKLHITKQSVNLIKEIQGYSRRKDAKGNIMEEPIKFNDHLMDALRYALHTYFDKGELFFTSIKRS